MKPVTIENNILKGEIKPADLKYTNIGEMMLDKMKHNPDAIAQVNTETDEEETYGTIMNQAVKCACWLKNQGVKVGDVIVICAGNDSISTVPFIATFLVGGILNPWDHELNISAARHYLKISEPKVIFVNEKAAKVVIDAAKMENSKLMIVILGETPIAGTTLFTKVMSEVNASEVDNYQCAKIEDHSQTAIILFSSGTTGLQKGVQLTHYSILLFINNTDILKLNGKQFLWFSSFCWISGTFFTLQAIVATQRRLLCLKFEVELACKIIIKYKVKCLFLGTSMINQLRKSKFLAKYDLSSLQMILTGGGVMTKEVQLAFQKCLPHVQLLQMYGMTELGGMTLIQGPNHKPGSSGTVATNVQAKVIDINTGNALGPNKSGELCFKTPSMMSSYYKNPQAAKDCIDSEGWMHSGDLGYYDEDGEFFILERIKELIKFRGKQISPSEIEALLATHPAVLEAAVVSVPHDTDEEHPIAFVTKLKGREVTEQELINLVSENLMDHSKLRAGVKFITSLPLTSTGKICRKELKTMAKELVNYN